MLSGRLGTDKRKELISRPATLLVAISVRIPTEDLGLIADEDGHPINIRPECEFAKREVGNYPCPVIPRPYHEKDAVANLKARYSWNQPSRAFARTRRLNYGDGPIKQRSLDDFLDIKGRARGSSRVFEVTFCSCRRDDDRL
jgi:hypothetical protein